MNAIKELKPERAIVIPEGATNGDMMLTVFSIEQYETVYVYGIAFIRVEFKGMPDFMTFNLEWWNAPCKRREE